MYMQLFMHEVFDFTGIVGDFKNYLSPDQNRRLEEKFKQRTEGTDILQLWSDIMK